MESTLRSDSEQSMPYMLGWHPAFRIATDERTRVFAGEKSYTIEEIKQASRTGALLLEADIITYKGMIAILSFRILWQSHALEPGCSAIMYRAGH